MARDTNWYDIPRSRHVVAWQPKFLADAQHWLEPDAVAGGSPAAIIEALQCRDRGERRVCRVVEWAGRRAPDRTALRHCEEALIDSSRHTEYWLVTDGPDEAQACFDRFHRWQAALRFEPVAPEDQTLSMLEQGPLRPAVAELQLLHDERVPADRAGWELLHRLAVPGGLAVVLHAQGFVVAPDAGWTIVGTGAHATVLQASAAPWTDPTAATCPGPRWVVAESKSWADSWANRFDSSQVHRVPAEHLDSPEFESLEDWPHVDDLQAVDFFCGTDPDDPTGEVVATRFIALVQALAARRLSIPAAPCRLTVVTHRAVLDVEDPRAQVLWGAARSMSAEVGTDAALDFRMVDLGSQEDLDVLERLDLAMMCAKVNLRFATCTSVVVRGLSTGPPFLTPIRPGEDPSYRLEVIQSGTGGRTHDEDLPAGLHCTMTVLKSRWQRQPSTSAMSWWR